MVIKMMYFQLLILTYCRLLSARYCYNDDDNHYTHMGTHTAYEYIRGNLGNIPSYAGCKPIQFWSVNRHGTRFPHNTTIYEIKDLEKIRDQIVKSKLTRLCAADLNKIARWSWNAEKMSPAAEQLTMQGWHDLMYIAKRYKAKYLNLLRPYSDSYYKFRHTDKQRTKDSFQAYAQGLFGDPSVAKAEIGNDTIMRPYTLCKGWGEETLSDENNIEVHDLTHGPLYRKLLVDVSKRLGVTLTPKLVQTIYQACSFEQAWYVNDRPAWCAAFKEEHMKLLEYQEDLNLYYVDGFGNKYSKPLGCLPLRDMYKSFKRTIEGKMTEPPVTVYFTHSPTIQLLITAMELDDADTPLTGHNYHQEAGREWRTSIQGPFAANLVVVLYKCGTTYNVLFLLNEVLVKFDECNHSICSWSAVKQIYRRIVKKCKLNCY